MGVAGVGPKGGLLAQHGHWGPRSHDRVGLLSSLPCLPCRDLQGFRGTWVPPSCLAGANSGLPLALHEVPKPSTCTHTLTSSSSSASANAKVWACTVLGTGALMPAVGALHSSRLSQEPRAWGSTSTSSRRASISV